MGLDTAGVVAVSVCITVVIVGAAVIAIWCMTTPKRGVNVKSTTVPVAGTAGWSYQSLGGA